MCRGDYGRHLVMQRLHDFVGWHYDDAATVQSLTITLPMFLQPGKCKNVAVPHSDVVRNLVVVDHLLFIKPVCRDKTASMLERSAVGRLFGNGLNPGIDGGIFGLGFFRPTWHQPPFG